MYIFIVPLLKTINHIHIFHIQAASEHFTDEFDDDDVNRISQPDEHGIAESFNFEGVAEVIGVTNNTINRYEGTSNTVTTYDATNDTVNSYEVSNGDRYSSTYDTNVVNGSNYGVNGSENAYSSNVIMTASGNIMDGSGAGQISQNDGDVSERGYDQDGLPNDPVADYSMFQPITTQGVPTIVN
ncbi:unnamed protein product [Owenia fusiformis]|uniref:Uncharacterized protein n=1 Tax=Owenia fusiformis TaxID=6347 RepID=A0A8S4PFS0_OWEFU|nr:unnamed protein product [Owenia fusiformis]